MSAERLNVSLGEDEEKQPQESAARYVAIVITLFVFAFGFAIGRCTAQPEPVVCPVEAPSVIPDLIEP